MRLILFDDHSWDNLLPLTFTRPVSDLRIGILTISEKWEKDLGMPATPLTREHLIGKFPSLPGEDNLLINASLLPNEALTSVIMKLEKGEALQKDGTLLAVRTDITNADPFNQPEWAEKAATYTGELDLVDFPWKIFQLNGLEIEADFKRLTHGRKSGGNYSS